MCSGEVPRAECPFGSLCLLFLGYRGGVSMELVALTIYFGGSVVLGYEVGRSSLGEVRQLGEGESLYALGLR